MATLTSDHHSDTQRLEAFSDGVFAIAITLLIIEVGVPEVHAGESLAGALRELWPSYVGYVVSFLTIGVMWMNHHQMFRDIERTDHTLTVLNLLLLMGVAFVPFPTALVAQYLREDSEQRLAATLAFGGTFTVLAVIFNLLWLHASRWGKLLDEHVSASRIRSRTLRYLPGAALYGVTLPLAFITPWISLAISAALAAFYLLPYEGVTANAGDGEDT